MKRPTFLQGAAVALAASLFGSILFAALAPIFSGAGVLRLLIATISFGYIIYLLGRSRRHLGRVTVVALWILLATVIWFLQPPLSIYLLFHLGTIWLVRSFYFHASLLSTLTDLGLNGLSLCAAVWAFMQTSSLFLGIWCFFLVQALFTAIPPRICSKAGETGFYLAGESRFEQAHRTAQAAVRKLSSIH